MRETDIEKYAKDEIEAVGGLMLKWVSPGKRGVPDRIVFWPGNTIQFIEFKKPGKPLSEEQKNVAGELAQFGAEIFLIDTFFDVDQFVHL